MVGEYLCFFYIDVFFIPFLLDHWRSHWSPSLLSRQSVRWGLRGGFTILGFTGSRYCRFSFPPQYVGYFSCLSMSEGKVQLPDREIQSASRRKVLFGSCKWQTVSVFSYSKKIPSQDDFPLSVQQRLPCHTTLPLTVTSLFQAPPYTPFPTVPYLSPFTFK